MDGLGWNPALGSGKSSAGGGKIPLQKDFSRRSEAASSGGGAATAPALAAIGGCFSPPETELEGTSRNYSGFFKTSHSDDQQRRRQHRRQREAAVPEGNISGRQRRHEDGARRPAVFHGEIYRATKNFSPACKIGQGGFGTVYRGTLADGTLVAIKRAKKSIHDKHLGVEFKSEIQILACIEHLNLVRFYGYLEHEDERVVVIEYVPNGTLREHLDGLRGDFLDLTSRLDIAIDVAHAVTYLHMYADDPIIHRDIKSSNILLTDNLRAKVADFGFARMTPVDAGVTHISTQVKGTAGYLDPEYLRTYQLTEKSDVYSFGVLLVELMTGRRPIETKREIRERITSNWAIKRFAEGNVLKVLDPNLSPTPATSFALEKVFELAAPMRKCAEVLWAIRKDYRSISTMEQPRLLSHPDRNTSYRDGRT
ncbi:unnamed protein product [Spirodela intermedia]|uniref:non-specific serine/threonine protein kinase n=1 Tax=Spirodela intermedia TaxID=51605 RepID=A0A7I8IDL0_SPIIN|nr:unnamed protein product [Spirodela intermedia]CAA6655484.1 unnamed protein product [Spirodela intermedia]